MFWVVMVPVAVAVWFWRFLFLAVLFAGPRWWWTRAWVSRPRWGILVLRMGVCWVMPVSGWLGCWMRGM